MTPRFALLAPPIHTGLSSVVRAWDHETQREVALKRPLSGEAASLARLRHEAHVLHSVRHPHLVQWVADGEDESGPFLATAWHPGISLEQWIDTATYAASPPQLANSADFALLFTPILQAVQALHDAGFAHADLTAANVLLVAEPSFLMSSLFLIDLGNATPHDANREPTADTQRPLHGSIFSMAPELFDGHTPDVLSDLYAIGVMAYFALAGQLPYQGETKPQVIAAHCRHWRTPLETLRPDLPPTLIHWIESLMAKKRTDRPPSALAALADLEKI